MIAEFLDCKARNLDCWPSDAEEVDREEPFEDEEE